MMNLDRAIARNKQSNVVVTRKDVLITLAVLTTIAGMAYVANWTLWHVIMRMATGV
jgi:hypothetical protein